jgi:hypothetical protein
VSLTPIERRRIWAVMAGSLILFVVCLMMGATIVAIVVGVMAPGLAYRVTGRSFGRALASASGGGAAVASSGRVGRGGRDEPRSPPARRQVGSIALLVVVAPVVLGLLSVLAGKVSGGEHRAVVVGALMSLVWAIYTAQLSGLLVGSGNRKLLALAAGAATALSVALWISIVGV